MTNPRTNGSPPYKIAVIHGGPGAPGYMAPVARELAKTSGVLEPLQTKDSIKGQVLELYNILNEHSTLPVSLIAHSWGGFLSIIFESQHRELVNKLILVGTGPFEEKYVKSIKEVRTSRFSDEEFRETQNIEKKLIEKDDRKRSELLEKLGNLSSRVDSFDPIPSNSEVLEYQPDVHNKVWSEAREMRRKGEFLEVIRKIQCPVVAIHGDYDPHPYQAVKIPLSKYLENFEFILIEKCGHYPWLEKNAKDEFYRILRQSVSSGYLSQINK